MCCVNICAGLFRSGWLLSSKNKDSAISITVHGARRGHHSGTSRQGPRSPPEDRTPVNEIHKCSIPKWTKTASFQKEAMRTQVAL